MQKNWQTKKLSEFCDFQRGLTYSKKDEVDYSNNVILRANNIGLDNKLNFTELKFINDKIDIPNNKKVRKGALIICTASGSKKHLGKVALVDKDYDYAFGGFMGQIIPKENIFYKFLFYIFLSEQYKELIKKLSDGANINNLKFSDIELLQVALPPLKEQKRIVKILDDVFADIEKAKENAEKNLKNVKELFETYLEKIFVIDGNNWQEDALKKITTKIGSGATPRGGKDSYETEGISLIRSLNVYDDGFRLKKLAFITNMQADKLSNVVVEEGDVLLNITGASIARCCVIPKSILPARVNQHVSIIRLQKEKMLSDFLHYILISKIYKDRLLQTGESGSTRQAITKSQIENFVVKFPKSLREQKKIVQKLDVLSVETKKLEEIYQQKIALLEELKKSILTKAFNGEL